MFKTYSLRIYPTPRQQTMINRHLGCARWIYNWGLEQKMKSYQETKKSLSYYDLSKRLPSLKREEGTEWLSDVTAASLQMSLQNLEKAYVGFFRHGRGFPKFKKKAGRQSYQYHSVKIDFEDRRVVLPKIGRVRYRDDRTFEGRVKTTTIVRTTTGKYFIQILVEMPDLPAIPKIPITEGNLVGIDLGLSTFATLSTGERIENPRFGRRSEARLKLLHRRLSRKEKGSSNRRRARLLLARQYERVVNQRRDFLHKLTKRLTNENQVGGYALEDLNVDGMRRNRRLSKSISDVCWSSFRDLPTRKCEARGKR